MIHNKQMCSFGLSQELGKVQLTLILNWLYAFILKHCTSENVRFAALKSYSNSRVVCSLGHATENSLQQKKKKNCCVKVQVVPSGLSLFSSFWCVINRTQAMWAGLVNIPGYLEMWPRSLKRRLVLLGVELCSCGVGRRRQRSEHVHCKLRVGKAQQSLFRFSRSPWWRPVCRQNTSLAVVSFYIECNRIALGIFLSK